jgi:hypothetical protein
MPSSKPAAGVDDLAGLRLRLAAGRRRGVTPAPKRILQSRSAVHKIYYAAHE